MSTKPGKKTDQNPFGPPSYDGVGVVAVSLTKEAETYMVAGVEVVLTRQPPRFNEPSVMFPKEKPTSREKARYEVRVAGAVVGHATLPHGWGKQPYICTGLWERYEPALGGHNLLSGEHYANKIFSRAQAAEAFAGYVRKGRALTQERIDAKIAERREHERLSEIESEKRSAERKIERQQQRRDAEARRLETLEGLESIRKEFAAGLSNSQTEMLQRAIEHYAVKPHSYEDD